MSNQTATYIWRCAKCFYHFANIHKVDGMLKEEKKCPKCKSLNVLVLTSKDIKIECKLYDPSINGYEDVGYGYSDNF